MVGSSREMVSRILRDLKAGGYISTRDKRLTIERDLPPAGSRTTRGQGGIHPMANICHFRANSSRITDPFAFKKETPFNATDNATR